MNFEMILFAFVILGLPAFFLAIVLLFSALPKHAEKKAKVMKISMITGLVFGLIAMFLTDLTYFQGNFLFFLLSPIAGLVVGGFVGMAMFMILIVVYYIPSIAFPSMKQSEVSMPQERGKLKKGRIAVSMCIFAFLLLGSFLKSEEVKLTKKYGSGTAGGVEAPLSTEQIEEAYNNFIVRNHSLILRGLLFRANVPTEILEDIYRRKGDDKNIRTGVVSHPNTSCLLKAEIFSSMTDDEKRYNRHFADFIKECPDIAAK